MRDRFGEAFGCLCALGLLFLAIFGVVEPNHPDPCPHRSLNPLTRMSFRQWVRSGIGSPKRLLRPISDLGEVFF